VGEAVTAWPSALQAQTLNAAIVRPDLPTLEAYRAGAAELGIEVEILQAFGDVEAGHEGAYLDTGEPLILFERHLMERSTAGRFHGARDEAEPRLPDGVSLVSWPEPGGYGTVSIQHRKLEAAAALDRVAALSSASWGLFQILGSNYRRAGFDSLQAFINAMYSGGADAHLAALVAFIKSDRRLLLALRGKRWTPAAELYNGRGQRGYDVALETAWRRRKAN
jgi:hypothetical protein